MWRNHGRRRLAIGSLAALWALTPAEALACSCAGPIPFAQALVEADATFVGDIVSVRFKASLARRGAMRIREVWSKLTGTRDSGLHEWYRSSENGRLVTIKLVEGFKGALAHTVEVHMGSAESACVAYPFEEGKRYLVFAIFHGEPPDGKKERLEVRLLTQRSG
jgi:hypothetical protein